MWAKALLVGGVVMAVGAAANAALLEGPVESRQALMKNVRAAAVVTGDMVRGDTEYEPRAALMAMRTMNSSIIGFVGLLPEGSHEGDTRALPEIWENWDDFMDRAEDMRKATQAVIDAEPEDVDAFRPLFAQVGNACRDCHETYRQPED